MAHRIGRTDDRDAMDTGEIFLIEFNILLRRAAGDKQSRAANPRR